MKEQHADLLGLLAQQEIELQTVKEDLRLYAGSYVSMQYQ